MTTELTTLTPTQQWRSDPERAMSDLHEWMAHGGSLRAFCAENGLSLTRVHEWIHSDPHRAGQYARAQELRAEFLAERVIDTGDEPVRINSKGDLDSADVALKRLKVDSLKWAASKLAPRRFGDKIEVDATVKHDVVGDLRAHLTAGSRLPLASKAAPVVEADAGGAPLVRGSDAPDPGRA